MKTLPRLLIPTNTTFLASTLADMSLYDFEDDPGWFANFLTWSKDLWARWTAPSPDKLPFDRSVLKTRLELCRTRIAIVRRNQEAFSKQLKPELEALAKSESPLAETKVRSLLDLERLIKVFDLLEPHLTLLLDSLDLPSHDMSPMLSVHAVLYAAPRVPRIEELMGIRQQLLQKYGQVLAITKTDLIERPLLDALDTPVTRLDILKWLNTTTPKLHWATELQQEEERDLALSLATSSHSTTADSSYPMHSSQFDDSHYDQSPQYAYGEDPSAPPHDEDGSDDDDDNNNDNNNDGGFVDRLGNSNDSGPTDSPIPPLETSAFDFPDVPSSPPMSLYPSLSLSNSLEKPLHGSLKSSMAH